MARLSFLPFGWYTIFVSPAAARRRAERCGKISEKEAPRFAGRPDLETEFFVEYIRTAHLYAVPVPVWYPGGAPAGEQVSGVYNTALTATGIFLSIASYGMYSFQVSDIRGKYGASTYIRSRVWTCALAVALCIGFVAVSALTGENPYSAQQSVCVLLFLGYRMVESLTDIYNAIDQRSGRLDIVGKTYAVRGAVTLASFTLTLWLTQDIVLTLALMLGASLVVFFVYSLPQARAFYAPEQPQNARVAALLWECLPLAVYSFLNTTTASIPKLALSSRMGETALGIYGPVTQPVVLLQVGATYLFNPFITVFADSYARRDKKGFFKAVFAVQGIVLALLPLGLAVAHFLGRWGLATFVSPGLADYQYLLGPMVVSAILTALVLFYSMVLTVMRCMKGLIVANVCAIAVSALASGPCIAGGSCKAPPMQPFWPSWCSW